MNDKFVYTKDDSNGCTIQAPDFTECKDCLFNNPEMPIRCLVFKEKKPSSVIYDKEPCDRKRKE